VSPKENRLEVNVDKTKYVVKSRNQKAERIHRIKSRIFSVKVWNSLHIWEQPSRIKVTFGKKLRTD